MNSLWLLYRALAGLVDSLLLLKHVLAQFPFLTLWHTGPILCFAFPNHSLLEALDRNLPNHRDLRHLVKRECSETLGEGSNRYSKGLDLLKCFQTPKPRGPTGGSSNLGPRQQGQSQPQKTILGCCPT